MANKPVIFTRAFWYGAGERAISTFAQSALGSLLFTAPITSQPWGIVFGIAGTATLVSLLKSFIVPGFTAGTTSTDDAEVVTGE